MNQTLLLLLLLTGCSCAAVTKAQRDVKVNFLEGSVPEMMLCKNRITLHGIEADCVDVETVRQHILKESSQPDAEEMSWRH